MDYESNAAISDILQRMDELIENGRAPAFGTFGKGNTVSVDKGQFMDLIADIRNNLPEQIAQAERLNSNCTKIVGNAQNRAKSIIEEAKVKARELTEENEITRLAREEAEKIMSEADEEARQVRAGATAYTKDILQQCQSVLSSSLEYYTSTAAEVQSFLSREIEILHKARLNLDGKITDDEEYIGDEAAYDEDDGGYYNEEE